MASSTRQIPAGWVVEEEDVDAARICSWRGCRKVRTESASTEGSALVAAAAEPAVVHVAVVEEVVEGPQPVQGLYTRPSPSQVKGPPGINHKQSSRRRKLGNHKAGP